MDACAYLVAAIANSHLFLIVFVNFMNFGVIIIHLG